MVAETGVAHAFVSLGHVVAFEHALGAVSER